MKSFTKTVDAEEDTEGIDTGGEVDKIEHTQKLTTKNIQLRYLCYRSPHQML